MGQENPNSHFYVYAYLDPRYFGQYSYPELGIGFLYEPFYVGKGQRQRMYHHLWDAQHNDKFPDRTRNKHKYYKIRKILRHGLEPYILRIFKNLRADVAFDFERKVIEIIGRIDLNTGPLVNLDDGGRGRTNVSQETREKISRALTGKKLSPERCKRISEINLGRKHSSEAREKISKNHARWNLGKHHSEETKEKQRQAKSGIKWPAEVVRRRTESLIRNAKVKYTIIKPDGEKIFFRRSLRGFCKENNISFKAMCTHRDKGVIKPPTRSCWETALRMNTIGWEIRTYNLE